MSVSHSSASLLEEERYDKGSFSSSVESEPERVLTNETGGTNAFTH